MRVMIIGAGGFLGRLLVQRLLSNNHFFGSTIESLVLVDTSIETVPGDDRIFICEGNITDNNFLQTILVDGVDVVFHLASIAGGSAEIDYALGYKVNLQASLELLNRLRELPNCPRLIYASSIAVYGKDLPAIMTEHSSCSPELSYGAHKVVMETVIKDLSRRNEIDGRVLRLPGIVARPLQPNGLRSAFMSDVMHAVARDECYECPVSPDATAWWMSAACCVDNLIYAAQLNADNAQGVWQLPVLHLSMSQIVDTLADIYGQSRKEKITFNKDEQLQALFGNYPPIKTPESLAIGFRHDGSARNLVEQAMALNASSDNT